MSFVTHKDNIFYTHKGTISWTKKIELLNILDEINQ